MNSVGVVIVSHSPKVAEDLLRRAERENSLEAWLAGHRLVGSAALSAGSLGGPAGIWTPPLASSTRLVKGLSGWRAASPRAWARSADPCPAP